MLLCEPLPTRLRLAQQQLRERGTAVCAQELKIKSQRWSQVAHTFSAKAGFCNIMQLITSIATPPRECQSVVVLPPGGVPEHMQGYPQVYK